MTFLKQVFEKLAPAMKRAERKSAHGFVALHGAGSDTRQHEVKDISSTGLYLLTKERWLPGEVVSLTLQMTSSLVETSERRIKLQAKVVRWGDDGVGLSFVLPDDPDALPWKSLLQTAAEQSEPNGVLDLARLAKAFAFLSRICPDAAEDVMDLIHGGLTKTRMANAAEIMLRAETLLPRDTDDTRLFARPRTVTKILEDGSWAEEDWIQHMWGGLLATSCSKEKPDDSNKSFVDLFSKLAAVHVRIFRYACLRATNIISIAGPLSPAPVICMREEIMEVAGSRELLCIERDIQHLRELGVLEATSASATHSDHYEVNITPSNLGVHLYARCKGLQDGI
ncbi:PilZ domain-containing protein [Telmatobacter sp. DSM 110680]|uniref:PilZ domain-containing protein n=1 Tax=Telmatobacter sp. DSM 110680 TaxID=3036704 RepID=A0AAU7DPG4_9BACT